MLFHMLQTHSNIKSAVINDINEDLTTCYKVVKKYPQLLIDSLNEIQKEYYSLSSESSKKQFFMLMRAEYNTKKLEPIRNTTLFFFLNRTCFNGLYRVNKSGLFNVPFGRYETPMICDPNTIFADSELLQRVEILTGDYTQTINYVHGNTLFYFDPPYRPLNATSSFNDYAKEAFNDLAQRRLKDFCDQVQKVGCHFMLSNSDCQDGFFDDLYMKYQIERVLASRSINSNPSKRGKLTELIIRNYEYMDIHVKKDFNKFMSQLRKTNQTLDYFFVDFNKVANNINRIKINLNLLNSLVNCADIKATINEIFNEYGSKPFETLEILIAVRNSKKGIWVVDKSPMDEPKELADMFKSPVGIYDFLESTQLLRLFQSKEITNLVDYVFGIEVGMDTHTRKNRSGEIMEKEVACRFKNAGIPYKEQVKSRELKDLNGVLGKDVKKFDFVVETKSKKYVIEVNFYNGGGSKPSETARAYIGLAPKINGIGNYEFVWITDGDGWHSAKPEIKEAYETIPSVYNLTSVDEFVEKIKAEGCL